jgi:murein DD-endopeptidase MepM/ murein hydrolase activator NlpD
VRSLAALILMVCASGAAAAADSRPDTWSRPRTVTFDVDWHAARAALTGMPQSGDAWSAANALARERFPAISNSPVPVLLPYAIGDDAHDRAADDVNPVESYLSGFEPTRFFHAGPTGYDATFVLRTRDVPGFTDIGYKNPVVVQISAFNLLYELPEPKGATIQPPGEIAKDIPGIRRQILEHTLRYSFERFGVPYVVSIQCFDGPQRRARLACRNADRIAVRFLRALRMAGGNPLISVAATSPAAVERPDAPSDAFRYHPVGNLVSGTGMRAPAGNSDATVYARIRFPSAAAPAYVNTQKFRRRGGLVIAWAPANGDDDESERDARPEARQYVWRDNFCERRDFAVGQCPSGRGHQGQDILGATCEPGPRKRDCAANRDDVVAAREGMILRESWNDSFFLSVNAQGERLRFRHLHMHPRRLDEDGIFSGRMVTEGQRLGTIGNYNRRPGMTTTHLHFELQVPTRDGYVRVNPYMTLVAAYEHLIGARGSEVGPPVPAQSGDAPAAETSASAGESPVKATAVVTAATMRLASVERDSPRIKKPGKAKGKSKARAKVNARARLAKASGRKRR